MGIVSFGPLADEVLGSVGGVTFSRGCSGATVRARPRPPRPRGQYQLYMQSLLARAAGAWPFVLEPERLLWVAYAASITLYDGLGRAYHPRAEQVWVWSYVLRFLSASGVGPLPPVVGGLAAPSTYTIDYNAHNLRLFNWAPVPNSNDWYYFIVYFADSRRAFNRMRRFALKTVRGSDAVPLVLATAIDGGWAVGTLVRAWVRSRVLDYQRRVSLERLDYFDFTVA